MSESHPVPGLTPPAEAALRPYGRRPSAGDFAYGSLRGAILSLALPPGAPLSRAALARQLGLSQTPVREALMRLQTEHLVEVVPSASTRVARIDLSSARQAHFLRRAVELEMVRRLALAVPPSLPPVLERHLESQQELLRRDDHTGFAEADDAFHGLLYEAAEISGLWDLVRSRSGHLDRLRRLHLPAPGKVAAILEEHGLIAAAIVAGDAAAAERHLRRHFSGTFASIGAIRAERPTFFLD
jgi:DNA-binding GntR family transcriptional regulator